MSPPSPAAFHALKWSSPRRFEFRSPVFTLYNNRRLVSRPNVPTGGVREILYSKQLIRRRNGKIYCSFALDRAICIHFSCGGGIDAAAADLMVLFSAALAT
jgi:hypothetical protein